MVRGLIIFACCFDLFGDSLCYDCLVCFAAVVFGFYYAGVCLPYLFAVCFDLLF